ncbi:uncharacterized protein CcaverHIS019_0500050 [Cutaneotrichosporon cavernicola]|uniref:Uncharacterized protein n=1 Tax=Cutaneotrichosporon cavernicola TaxID=279322 RepID=A0AA48L5N5_9TREE|nr:uncharacterized protein CcaverHIS019_0500050 [Cutaneotrichosporon cavernicola]BEI92377.1 hypothetical protein CcaverHIS019_0500050 [Cutaneotrichosporon cavernicola]BEJ00148.1 hypothetical protein CcaverHIS631_0500050 [Cutaneotrichosporon cavernicola]
MYRQLLDRPDRILEFRPTSTRDNLKPVATDAFVNPLLAIPRWINGQLVTTIRIVPMTDVQMRRPVNTMIHQMDNALVPLQVPPLRITLHAQSWVTPGRGQVDNDDDLQCKRSADTLPITDFVLDQWPFNLHAPAAQVVTHHPRMRRQQPGLAGLPLVCEPDNVVGYARDHETDLLEPHAVAAVQEHRRPPEGSSDMVGGFIAACHAANAVIRLTYCPNAPEQDRIVMDLGDAPVPLLSRRSMRWLARRLADQLGYMTAAQRPDVSLAVGNIHMRLEYVAAGGRRHCRRGQLRYSRNFGWLDNGQPIVNRTRPNHCAVQLAHAFKADPPAHP